MTGDPPINCVVPWPNPWPDWPAPFPPAQPLAPWVGMLTFTSTPSIPRLSDEDVERVAKRVVELLREEKP